MSAGVCLPTERGGEPKSPQSKLDDIAVNKPGVADALAIHGNAVYAADILDKGALRPDRQDGMAAAHGAVRKAQITFRCPPNGGVAAQWQWQGRRVAVIEWHERGIVRRNLWRHRNGGAALSVY